MRWSRGLARSLPPIPVFQGALGQDLRGNGILAMHVAEEMHDVLRPGQQGQVSLDDDAVETVIYKNQEALKELREGFHRSPPSDALAGYQNHLSGRPVESTRPEAAVAFFASWRLGEKQ